ncbi:unnamed protein product [Lymnaea stagnalis]|uniref:Uncharacterized protein n=1 Tax=Lymnaea stagnalis TaxID=6523 RepID=A0AAV2IMM9_LYMST
MDRMPKYYGKRGAQSHPQTLEMLYPAPRYTIMTPNIRSSKECTNGRHQHISSPILPAFDSLTKQLHGQSAILSAFDSQTQHLHNHAIHHRDNGMTVGDGVSKSVRVGSEKPSAREDMSKNKRIPDSAEDLYNQTKDLYNQAEGLNSQNEGLYNQAEGLYSQNEGLYSQNEGLYSQNEGMNSQNQNEGLYSQNEGLYSQNEGLYSQNEGLYSLE